MASGPSPVESNERYLNAALIWLRMRLNRLAASYDTARAAAHNLSNETALATAEMAAARGRRRGRRLFPREPEPPQPQMPPPRRTLLSAPTDEEVRRALAEMLAAEEAPPPPALTMLARVFGLTRFEQNVLLLCAAMELDPYVAVLCARAHDDPNRSYPTFALAMKVFDDPEWEAISPDRPLRYLRLIEIAQAAGQPLTTSPLRADERILHFMNGLSYLDDRLALLLIPLLDDASELTSSQRADAEQVLREIEQTQRAPIVQLTGRDSTSKRLVAAHIAERLGRRLFILDPALMPQAVGDAETLNRLWQRESVLLPITLYVDAAEIKPNSGEPLAILLAHFLSRSDGLIFLDTREQWPGLFRETVTIEVARPTPVEQRALWRETLTTHGALADAELPARLAGQFDLNAPTIRAIPARAGGAEAEAEARIWELCLQETRPRLDLLAQRIEPKASWEDLILPEMQKDQLAQIVAQVSQRSRVYDDWGFRDKLSRGLGISALFAGPSGTGKTMAAEVLARVLHLNLYRIDLSAVVSKYIGETEKNLRQLFDAAENGGALLFFDEADALFGKRSEVKDSHDRYANIEINYLLQRIESYSGLAILATNMKNALDQAFLRRLRFIVNFPFPGIKERADIWRGVFPRNAAGEPRVPLALREADFERAARLNLPGGAIHNVALNASFMAAERGVPITLDVLFEAARAEYRKLELPINETDFALPRKRETPEGGAS